MSEDNLTSVDCTDVISTQEPIIQLTENGVEGFEILCRLCANRSDHLIPIYSEEGVSNDLADKMNLYLPVKVSKNDLLPLQCCFQCATTVLTWHELVVACVEADRRLKEVQTEVEKEIAEQAVTPGPSQAEVERPGEERCTTSVFIKSQIKSKNKLKEESYTDVSDLTVQSKNKIKDEEDSEIENEDSVDLELSKPVLKKFQCSLCNKNFFQKISLERHIRIHRNERVSDISDFKEKMNTENKIKNEEVSEIEYDDSADPELSKPVRKTFQCIECNKHFFQKTSLERHIRIHRNERPFTCDVCGKGFRDRSGLTRHIRHVHIRTKDFSCDICVKSFASAATRDDHRRSHTKECPFICQNCGKSFGRKASLYIHSKIHSDVFPFECSVCEKKFRRRQELSNHVSTHSGEKQFNCVDCGKWFRIKSSLTIHRLIHSENKPFSCEVCGISYRQARYLRRHNCLKHSSNDSNKNNT